MPQEAITTIVYFVFIGLLFYFLLYRPQKKREKEAKQLMESLETGDLVLTVGGITGRVIHVGDETVTVETSAEKTKIEFIKSAIASIKEKANAPAEK